MQTDIINISTGTAKEYGEGENSFLSAYKKDQSFNFIDLDELGIVGDVQVDKRYHGGVDKAIHIGSALHFNKFKKIYQKDMDKLSIGCNIIVSDLDENDICIGDVYTIGDIEIEVTQPRQPCWKIGAIFGKEISRYIVKENATGWYVRVLTPGSIDINDVMILQKRVSEITIKELSQYLHIPPKNKELIEKILATPSLANSYKEDLQRVLNK